MSRLNNFVNHFAWDAHRKSGKRSSMGDQLGDQLEHRLQEMMYR